MNTSSEMRKRVFDLFFLRVVKLTKKIYLSFVFYFFFFSSSIWSAQEAKTKFSISLSFSPRRMRKRPCSPHWRPHELATNYQKQKLFAIW